MSRAFVTPPVGELRPSQLLHTFGIGSLVDLPHISVLVMGLEDWDQAQCRQISEPRLLAAVRRSLGEQVESLLQPPPRPDERPGRGASEDVTGVPVAPFPRFLRCPACNYLGPIASGLFELKTNPYRPEQAKYVHKTCTSKLQDPTVLPARFLVACEQGHLDDFPWKEFVHRGASTCQATFELEEFGVSGEATDVEVRCTKCGVKRRMAEAFERDPRDPLPICRGRRPHLRDVEEEGCGERVAPLLLGASDIWFPLHETSLTIPTASSPLGRLVEERWLELETVEEPRDLAFLRRRNELGPLVNFDDATIFQAIRQKRTGSGNAELPQDLKPPEWALLVDADPRNNTDDFRLRPVTPPLEFAGPIAQVVLAERLREVSAILGFTRLNSPSNFGRTDDVPRSYKAPLSRRRPTFVPAAEVRGEGIFLRLDEARLQHWLDENTAKEQDLRTAHVLWRTQRGIDPPDAGFPGLRFALLHSLSHALMRQLALECGYAQASIRERIYCAGAGETGGPMAGVLLYTAAPDSEGTLGGLVQLGQPAELGRHLAQALESMRLCASDPLCAEHHPHRDGVTLHGAACHACLFAPETSCERGNFYLDRGLLVRTVAGGVEPFFAARNGWR